jgi:hypothetical protein
MSSATRPVSIDGHSYAQDRAPYDDPIGLTAWRYRWTCSCGGTGNWYLTDQDTGANYRGWRKHCSNLRDRGRVPRSTDQRTDVQEGQ